MSDSLKQVYEKIATIEQTHTVKLHNSEQVVEWVPLLGFGCANKNLGIVNTGFWGIKIDLGLVILDSKNAYLYVLSLLEIGMEQIESDLISISRNYGLDTKDELEFPFVEIVKFALNNEKHDYWLTLAFSWFDCLGNSAQTILSLDLSQLEGDKNISQKMRHLARKKRNQAANIN